MGGLWACVDFLLCMPLLISVHMYVCLSFYAYLQVGNGTVLASVGLCLRILWVTHSLPLVLTPFLVICIVCTVFALIFPGVGVSLWCLLGLWFLLSYGSFVPACLTPVGLSLVLSFCSWAAFGFAHFWHVCFLSFRTFAWASSLFGSGVVFSDVPVCLGIWS